MSLDCLGLLISWWNKPALVHDRGQLCKNRCNQREGVALSTITQKCSKMSPLWAVTGTTAQKNKLSQVCIAKAANALHVAKKPLSPYTHLLDRLKWKDPILFLQKPIMDWKKRNEKSFQLESHHTSVGIYFLSRFL